MKWIRDPKHKDKVITILVLLVLGILSLLVVVSTIKLSSMETRLNQLANSIPQYEKPKDGYTPIKNVDYVDGIDGKDGTNAVSTHTETTIVKEVPIPGQDGRDGRDGKDGKDAKNMSITVDPETCVLSLNWDGDDFPIDLVKIPGCEVL